MGYLRYFDYYLRAQDANIRQWIANNAPILSIAERAAQAVITSRLVQKYDVASEFQNTTIFNELQTYQANALVELNYPAWVNTVSSYPVRTYVSFTDGNVYRCILPTTGAHEPPTNPTYWVMVGAQYDLLYIPFPYEPFDIDGVYSVGDRTFYKGKIYQCLIPSFPEDHDQKLQDINSFDVPLSNYYPDDKAFGKQYWGTGTPYSVSGLVPVFTAPGAWAVGSYTAGTRVTYNGQIWKALANTSAVPGSDITSWQSEAWTNGDNRDDELVMYYVDIVIYNIMPRIAPQAIPPLRINNHKTAMDWLNDAAKGNVTPNLPVLQHNEGSRIRFGSQVKKNNTIS